MTINHRQLIFVLLFFFVFALVISQLFVPNDKAPIPDVASEMHAPEKAFEKTGSHTHRPWPHERHPGYFRTLDLRSRSRSGVTQFYQLSSYGGVASQSS